MKENELEATAYREAGYAFAYCLTGREFECVSIVQDSEGLGGELTEYVLEGGGVDFELLFRDLSGRTAGRIHSGAAFPSGDYSRKQVFEYWDEAFYYLNERCPGVLAERIITMMEQYIGQLMRRQWSSVTRIVEALLAQQTLTYGQVRDIILDTVLTSQPDEKMDLEEDLRNIVDECPVGLVARDLLWNYR